jgi:hypothetical protein
MARELAVDPTLYQIVVKNDSPEIQDFFFFQKPAQYTGGTQIYSNSIYNQKLRGAGSGATLTFTLLQQYFAGAQDQAKNLIVGQASGSTSVAQEIALTPSTPNATTMQLDPLGLTPPTAADGVQPGAFRITTPQFNPATNKYNIGLSVQTADGGSTLSNFVSAQPGKNTDCQPVVIFYVQTGTYIPGSVINFTQSSVGAALCDATQGVTTFQVVYNANGSWTVNGGNQKGLSQLI